jgi:hypothetical protein
VNWKAFLKPFAAQFVGQALLGAVAWYWLNLGVASTVMVAANALIAIVLLLAWSALDAYGLGVLRNWMWAVPAVALTPLMGFHVVAAIVIPLLWILVLFPSAAAGKWKVNLAPSYIGVCLGILLAMTVLPAALLNWIPSLSGLTAQAISFGARSILAYTIFAGGWAALLQYIAQSQAAELRS